MSAALFRDKKFGSLYKMEARGSSDKVVLPSSHLVIF